MEILPAEEFLDFDIPNQSDYEHAISQAIKFAKAHVEAALKTANKVGEHYTSMSFGDAITKSYPLENIK